MQDDIGRFQYSTVWWGSGVSKSLLVDCVLVETSDLEREFMSNKELQTKEWVL